MTHPSSSTDLNAYKGYAAHSEETVQGSVGDSVGHSAGDSDSPSRVTAVATALKINRSLGVYAGVFALTTALFSIGGIIWGLLRPTYTAYVEDAETASIAVESNTAFVGYAWFVIATAVLAAGIALTVFLRSPRTRGIFMLLWLGIVSAVGSVAFLVFGSYASDLLHGVPSDYAEAVGESFSVAPPITPGVALAVGPFLAVCMYWCATFVTPPEEIEA
ncbi:hypothetical protein CDES_09495 [Corynebacterium deserti GIMN1.010]|uniref:DUF2567 domain-containing protein n=1 Tax=Corynebacterium deserti GIMN1.010 TaxID=931089 RepID=A0A0M4CY44_9CORY|nr:hypothetical protein [Corynebacterium deserti]ALC06287.1 hypothetical protein CDES_09495 [Corynebacterium deserti GIMN1.010]